MKYLIRATAIFLLLTLTIDAAPLFDIIFSQVNQYENGAPKDADDVWTWSLYCNDTPDETGAPYELELALPDGPDVTNTVDFAPLFVAGGEGTYHCRAATWSTKYLARSAFSEVEKAFTVTAQSAGFVPVAPTW